MGAATEIFIVDDEPIVASMLSSVLADEGFDVTCAGSGADALRLLEMGTRQVRVLVADVNLGGGMDGIELAAAMRARGAGIATIFMTGDPPRQHQARAPADAIFLEKPFLPFQLVDAVRRLDRKVAA